MRDDTNSQERRRPTLPGDFLRNNILQAKSITQDALADAMCVSRYSINQLVNGRRSVTPEMALRLGRATSTTPDFWMNMQRQVDLFEAQIDMREKLIEVRVLIEPASDDDLFGPFQPD